MIFSSTLFLCYFLLIFLLAYYLTPTKYKNLIALLFSFGFYAWGAPIFIFFLLGSCIIDFKLINYFEAPRRKYYLVISLILNIGLLAYFKYANFFIENLDWLIGGGLYWKEVMLPIGISFFTFQKISYSMDVYWKKDKHLTSFTDYLLYITLFPQLIAGPIVRFRDVASQIRNRVNNENYEMRLNGAFRFCVGLSKKVLIANVMADQVNDLHELYQIAPWAIHSSEAWVFAIAYTFQIYFDFSGYSDMAIGLGKMIGFNFPENFNFPYLSRSITEFWQRWHMTLGAWMKDYLYIPLGGNRNGRIRTLINLSLVFLISGLWHGAAWNFIFWGVFHGFLLIIERLFLGKLLKMLPIINILYTFLLVLIGWVFFSSETMEQALFFIDKMFAFDYAVEVVYEKKFLFYLIVAVGFSFFAINKKTVDRLNNFQNNYASSNRFVLSTGFIVCLFLFILSLGEIMGAGYNPFIYYRF